MKLSNTLLAFFLICISSTLKAQNDPSLLEYRVISYDDSTALAAYQEADLDADYPNLMDPVNQKEHAEEIFTAWRNIHQKVYGLIEEEGFNWGVPDDTIQLLHKIYFNKDGEVQYYFFRVFNENVPKEKKMAFQKILERNLDELSISFKQEMPFAQCGKSAYPNSPD